VIEKLTVMLLVKEFPVFVENEDPLPCLDDIQFTFCSLRSITWLSSIHSTSFFQDSLLGPDETGLNHIFCVDIDIFVNCSWVDTQWQ